MDEKVYRPVIKNFARRIADFCFFIPLCQPFFFGRKVCQMKTVCSVILFLVCYCAFAQPASDTQDNKTTIIGQCMQGTSVYARLACETSGRDTAYILSIKNPSNNLTEYHSIEFSGGSRAAEQLYVVIKQMIEKRNRKRKDYSTTLVLGSKLVVISTTRILGVTSAVVYLPQGYNYLTERQLDKVFGKI